MKEYTEKEPYLRAKISLLSERDEDSIELEAVSRNYLDWLVSLPWGLSTKDKLDLDEAANLLDEQHYGLSKVKDRLLEFLAVIKEKVLAAARAGMDEVILSDRNRKDWTEVPEAVRQDITPHFVKNISH